MTYSEVIRTQRKAKGLKAPKVEYNQPGPIVLAEQAAAEEATRDK